MVEYALVLALFSLVAMGGFVFIRWHASNQIQGTGIRMTTQASNP
jgi:Flp pilus assembly pilin Flp